MATKLPPFQLISDCCPSKKEKASVSHDIWVLNTRTLLDNKFSLWIAVGLNLKMPGCYGVTANAESLIQRSQ